MRPYLGGWRHKCTGVIYLNVQTQTETLKMLTKETCTRFVQYIWMIDKETQTPCDHPTQMCRSDCFISNESDKYLTSKPYETHNEMIRRIGYDEKARIIQRSYRMYKLLKHIREFARQYRELVENSKKYEEEKAIIYKKRHQEEILRRIDPKSRLDFDMLYDIVEKWRHDRLASIKKRFFRAARCAENYLILEKTVEMLNAIDRNRQKLRNRCRIQKRVKFLTINCKSVSWHGYKGKLVKMVTMRNQRARELKTIYESLTDYSVTRGERMEILTMLKKSLEVHNCVAVFHLIRLLDEELDYLSRGMTKYMSLNYFRERIACKRVNSWDL